METCLDPRASQLPRASEAERIIRSCVHCGFCNATCPTYQLLGDELDGPRGRIYQIKQMLEGEPVGRATQQHLDRCLSCRSCETTCPSGVKYHALLDIGRAELAQRVQRPWPQRILRNALRFVMTRPHVFACGLRLGRLLRPLLPSTLRDKIPASIRHPGSLPCSMHARKVLMLDGCVQPSLSPNTNAAAARVLDRLGIEVISQKGIRCCGALDYHLDAQEHGLRHARANIDIWWPWVESGIEAIVQTASGCGAFVKEYGDLLAGDPAYADKARRVSALALDIAEVLDMEPVEKLRSKVARKIAVHSPCTLQHGQKLGGSLERVLRRLDYPLVPVADGHLCCGSAGTYSILQPQLSRQLRDSKLVALQRGGPAVIATANIGCHVHLASTSEVPVRHWIEVVDDSLDI